MGLKQKAKRELKRLSKGLYKELKIALKLSNEPKTQMDDEEIENDRTMYLKMKNDDFIFDKKFDWIIKYDKYAKNGDVDNCYFIQDIWGARKVFEARKAFESKMAFELAKCKNDIENTKDIENSKNSKNAFIHYDVGSSVAGFIAHLQAMKQKVCLIDIRPMKDMQSRFLRGYYDDFNTPRVLNENNHANSNNGGGGGGNLAHK